VALQPTATLFTKQWPEERFAEVARRLQREFGLAVVVTGAPHERALLERVEASGAGERALFWSDLDLEELFALIGRSRLFVGNDSGPTHAAAALGIPVVVVWGSSSIAAWRPWGTDHEVVASALPCMPCPGYRCAAFGQPKCILDIEVERVMEACARMLARAPTSRR
jgi:ADP-heptose:LPS heptosyltransferase